MKRTALIAAALATSCLSALAADLPRSKAPVVYTPPPPVFTWTGFYVGLNAGAIIAHDASARAVGTPAYLAAGAVLPRGFSNDSNVGFIGGGQIGYNHQFGALVAGLEADFQGTSLRHTDTTVATLATGALKTETPWLGTVRGRFGFLANERLMIYATGGLAYGQTKLTSTMTGTAGALAGATWSGSNSKTRAGWTLGAGAEYAITNNWTARLEYLYYDLGKASVAARGLNAAGSALDAGGLYPVVQQKNRGSIVRVGLNYKF